MTDHTHIVERLMALAVIAADIRAGDTAEFYVARRPVSEHNYKEALAVLRETLDAEITRLRDEAEALRKALTELVACEQEREDISRRKQRRENSCFAHPEKARAIKAEHQAWKARKFRAWNASRAAIDATKGTT